MSRTEDRGVVTGVRGTRGRLAVGVLLLLWTGAGADPIPAPPFLFEWGSNGGGYGQFVDPCAMTFDDAGFLYVADADLPRVQRFSPDGAFDMAFEWSAPLYDTAVDVAVDPAGRVYVADAKNRRVLVFAPDGSLSAEWGPFGASASPSMVSVAADRSGFVYVGALDRIYKVDPNGTIVFEWSLPVTLPSVYVSLSDLCVDTSGVIWAAELHADRWTYVPTMQRFAPDGALLSEWSPPFDDVDAQGIEWIDIALGPGGIIYCNAIAAYSQEMHVRIQVFAADGTALTAWRNAFYDGPSDVSGLFRSRAIAVDQSGALYVADMRAYDGWLPPPDYPEDAYACRILKYGSIATGAIVAMSRPDLPFTVDGVAHTGVAAFDWDPGSIHVIGTATSHEPVPGYRYELRAWSDGGGATHSVTADGGARAYVASFDTLYRLTMNTSPGGSAGPATGWYPADTTMTLAATPNPEWEFIGWTGSDVDPSTCCAHPDWLCCMPASYTGPKPSTLIRLTGPITQEALFLAHGFEFSISASDTDPFANTDVPAEGPRRLYLWATCLERNISAIEARAVGSLDVLSFTPMNGALNVLGGRDLMLAMPCLATDVGPVALGYWTVLDSGGELCLAPSAHGGVRAAVDCLRFDELRDFVVTGFSSSGAAPCVMGGNRCGPDSLAAIHLPIAGADTGSGASSKLSVYPNPFSGTTAIGYSVESASPVSVRVYDVLGRLIRAFDEAAEAGRRAWSWDGRDDSGRLVPSGIYFVRFHSESRRETAKVVKVALR
jgi:hypothetical protein